MSKLFPNYYVNTKKPSVFREIAKNENEKGYHPLSINDVYGNHYNFRHEVIMAEGLGLPKHLWPVDELGRRYIVDHKIPVGDGGTDAFENLHLIPKSDNAKNEITVENYKCKKGKKIGLFDVSNKLKKVYDRIKDVEQDGFCRRVVFRKLNSGEKYNGYFFKRL